MKVAIITGSGGLIGSEASKFFHNQGYHIIGIDNDMRAYFFGSDASTNWNVKKLQDQLPNYSHSNIDIRDYDSLEKIFSKYSSDIKLIIHTAAQPSHDWAAKEPFTDFTVNANGTLNLLEATRKYCKKASFISLITLGSALTAAKAALWEILEAPDVNWPWILVHALAIHSGAPI